MTTKLFVREKNNPDIGVEHLLLLLWNNLLLVLALLFDTTMQVLATAPDSETSGLLTSHPGIVGIPPPNPACSTPPQ